MTTPDHEPDGTLDRAEVVARAILSKRWFNQQTSALKPDAFEPPSDGNLSVTRHQQAGDRELWTRCRAVADMRNKSLHGRADLSAAAVSNSRDGMSVLAAPRGHDPGHAHIVGWPPERAICLSVQVALAASAQFVPVPPSAD